MVKVAFSIIDYTMFGLMLAFSAIIGFYYAFKDRSRNTTDQFLLGGRNLKSFPVAMSILASFTSAISVLGFSQEVYKFGTMYSMIGISYCISKPITAEIFVPFYYRLRITSAYEVRPIDYSIFVFLKVKFTS